MADTECSKKGKSKQPNTNSKHKWVRETNCVAKYQDGGQ